MKKVTKLLLTASMLAGSLGSSFAGRLTGNVVFSASLNGSQEIPAVTTNAIGIATFTINSTWDTMCINMTVNGLSGVMTGAHVHKSAM